MRKSFLTPGLFFSGVIVGILLTSHVWIVSSRLHLESTLAAYQHEQVIRAARARRSDDTFRQVLHSMNAADAQAGVGFLWLQRTRDGTYWSWFKGPWSVFPLIWDIDPYLSSSPQLQKGARLSESHYRSQAALALERFGAVGLADQQWRLATELQPAWSLEQHRDFALGGRSLLGEDYEAAYLDSATSADFAVALEHIRASYAVSE